MSWLLNLGWVLWAVSAAVYLLERQRSADRRPAEQARLQAPSPEELRGSEFHRLLTGRAPLESLEAEHSERRHATIVMVGLILLAAAQGLASSS